jgi:hypothetical protein
MVVSSVIGDAKANPFAATLPPTVPGDEVDFDRGEEDNGPDGAMAAGAADNLVTQPGG